MATKSSKSKAKTIIDVTHADSTAPSPNSKSVIVPSRPILKDPMVVADEDQEKAAPVSGSAKNVKPTNSGKDPSIAELAAAAAAKDAAKTVPKEIEKPDAKPAEKTDDKEQGENDSADQDTKLKPDDQLEAEAAEQAKHDAAIDKLIESKQYYLPINSVEKRRSKRFVGLGILLSLLLVVAWADIALDAGLIKVSGIKPVTHFFSN